VRLAALAALLLLTGCGGDSGGGGGLVPIGAGLSGPSGLQATVFARGLPLMSAFAFDARGRLWVTVSGANTHGSDGVFVVPRAGAKPVRVVSGPRGPLGLVWVGPTLYVSSLGRVTAFSGLRGSRFAHRRTILAGPPGGGENNNLVRAPDGRLVMGVSASCDHCTPPTKWSGSVVSFRTDGGGLRLVARGIRAPFGLAYTASGELLASMNQRDDLGAKTPGDWLAVVKQGQDWGFPDCYGQGGAACAGVPKPVGVLDPHAAAGGVAPLTRELGGGFDGSALVAEWQLSKVVRVDLGSGEVEPFLTGLKNPLPVIATAGGAVLVGDWGTGRIYRIAKG
jgi:glucose/arabinose dehydrogenase